MRIFFLPELSGPAYLVSPDGKPVMMDTMTTGLAGLVSLLELRLGLHVEDVSQQERLVAYYDAMRTYMKDNPGNVLEKSFAASGMGTAAAVLEWRDQLVMTGWQFEEGDSKRLTTIADIEKILGDTLKRCDMARRIADIIARRPDCSDIELILPCDADLLKPIIRELVMAMKSTGACFGIMPEAQIPDNNLSKVRRLIANGSDDKISLDPNDSSFRIWKFSSDHTAAEYLAQLDDATFDVWVNADNKQMDNWLSLMGKPVTGSVMSNCSPQLTQLFVTGICIHATTLNVKILIEWLNMPLHPIDRYFRSVLADAVAENGGYRNEKCWKLVQDYIDGKYIYLTDEQKALPDDEIQTLRNEGREKRISLAGNFLPSLKSEPVTALKLSAMVTGLAAWARQRAHLMTENGESPMWIEQLFRVASMCDAFGILLSLNEGKAVTDADIDSWLNAIIDNSNFTHAIAERGCRSVIDSPSKLISVADNVIWMGVEGDNRYSMECSFLLPTEKAALEKRDGCSLWSEDCQNAYHKILSERAFAATARNLVLTYCERRGGEVTAKHPFMVLLEKKVKNLKEFISTPSIEPDRMVEIEPTNNISVDYEQPFDHADLIRWPDHLSPTKVGTLVEFPFDFLMSELVGIVSDCQVQMSDTKKTEGNVAHAVIQALFAPRDGEGTSTPQQISERIGNEFDKVFAETIESKGAIFLLDENRLAAKVLKEQLRESVGVLVAIIKDNGLSVTGCEKYVEERMNLGLNDETGKRDMLGYIDMTLEDREHHPVIFDFKWSKSKYYPGLLEQNRSVQLELYRHMLGAVEHDAVERTAYYLMPQNRLYSKEHFEGSRCHQISPANGDEIVGQLCRSIAYRKEQIESGLVENGLSCPPDDLEYGRDTVDKNLFPLKLDPDGCKEGNRFTDYNIFIL